jgi:NADPH:quinone reductase-like Zn-dependent oxidoreductase
MDFEIKRDDLRRNRCVDTDVPEPAEGEALLRVDAFALTANNVSYAAFGDAMGYWQFFPASEEGWGRVPVWGFADVVASRADGVSEGDRLYGYMPMSSHLLVQPERVRESGFTDGAAHRAGLPSVYNRYQQVRADPGYRPEREREQALLHPLFTTSFLIDDFLAANDLFGATRIVVASASSKTAVGLAHLLHTAGRGEVVGLTSPGNVEAVAALGCYDRTLAYDRVADLDAGEPSVLVDMAGDGAVRDAVHHHLGGSLRHSCQVGVTHWESVTAPVDLPGPTPTFFFAPDRIVARREDWGPEGLEERIGAAWQQFLPFVDGWLEIVERHGTEAVAAAWADVLEGRTRPNEGLVLSMHEATG